MKSEITDLEAEILRLKKKCEHLESIVHLNDSTPRRTEVFKRLMHESPAPEMPNTPILEEVQKVVKLYFVKIVLDAWLLIYYKRTIIINIGSHP